MKLKTFATLIVALFVVSSCSLTKKIYGIPDETTVTLKFDPGFVEKVFYNIEKPVKVQVNSSLNPEEFVDISGLPALTRKSMPRFVFTPSLREAMQSGVSKQMQNMGFVISPKADHTLRIEMKSFRATCLSSTNIRWQISFAYRLVDEAGETILMGNTVSGAGASTELAFQEAMKQVQWDRIATPLTIAKTAAQEKNAQVTGNGDTALEHTVIRWYITSAPQGADVSWRVVSSTPDVANTNSNYVGNTPYESTESFDIKGLTYNNSGNVQIEVTCDRSGYMPQKKRFNLRQVIDQKEISAKFNLIKEE